MIGIALRYRSGSGFSQHNPKDHNQMKEMSLDAIEFIRRFLLHVLPCGFVKIRHFGFLANRNRRALVARCRELLPPWTPPANSCEPYEAICPVCKISHLRVINSHVAGQWRHPSLPTPDTASMDTS